MRLVAFPVIANPFVAVRLVTNPWPNKFVTVSRNFMLLVLIVMPAGELTVNVNVADGWNIFVPFGYMLLMVGKLVFAGVNITKFTLPPPPFPAVRRNVLVPPNC